MANLDDSKTYDLAQLAQASSPGLLKLGMIASISALAGGLAVAFFYRETLRKLRNPVVLPDSVMEQHLEEEFPDADQDGFESRGGEDSPHLIQD